MGVEFSYDENWKQVLAEARDRLSNGIAADVLEVVDQLEEEGLIQVDEMKTLENCLIMP